MEHLGDPLIGEEGLKGPEVVYENGVDTHALARGAQLYEAKFGIVAALSYELGINRDDPRLTCSRAEAGEFGGIRNVHVISIPLKLKKATIKCAREMRGSKSPPSRREHDSKESERCMHSLIVHNSRSGFGSDAIFEFERFLLDEGDDCLLRILPRRGGGREAVRDAEDFDVVVVSGGDGTAASILYALCEREVPVCIFPSGTANLLFANLGNAMEPRMLARACQDGVFAKTDLGEMSWQDEGGMSHTRGFALMAGMGFDAQIMKAALPNKRSMGEAAYFAAALSNMHPDVAHFSVECDGRHFEYDGISCVACNNAMMQGGIELVPNCRMDDGMLDLMVLEASETVGLIRPMFAGLLDRTGKNIDRPHIEHLRGRDIHVNSTKAMPLQVDGEVTRGVTCGFHAQVLPACNRLIVDRTSRYAPADGVGTSSEAAGTGTARAMS